MSRLRAVGAGTTLSQLPAFCRGEGGPHTPRTFKGTLGGDWCKWGLSRTTGVKTVHQSGGLHCENGKEAA